MALAVNIKDYGWWSVPLSDLDTGPFPYEVVSSFFDNRYNPDDELMDDDRYVKCFDCIDNYACVQWSLRLKFTRMRLKVTFMRLKFTCMNPISSFNRSAE